MTGGFDEGPIIVVESYKFSKGSSYENIRIQVYEKGCLLAAKVLKNGFKPKLALRVETSRRKYSQILQTYSIYSIWFSISKDQR